jgi:hypothetical protein
MAPRPHVAYGNLFTIQTDSNLISDRDRRRRVPALLLPEQAPGFLPTPRPHGAPFRAAEPASNDPPLLPDHASPRGRALSHNGGGSVPSYSNTPVAAAPPARRGSAEVEFAGNMSIEPTGTGNSLRRRGNLRDGDYRQLQSMPLSQQQQYQVYQRYYQQPPEEDDQPHQFSSQQFIQMLVLICIGYLVWDANSNVQMASARLALYRQETVQADIRATQLYDLLHEMRKDFRKAGQSEQPIPGTPHSKEIYLMEETRLIKQQINKLKKENSSAGQQMTSLKSFLDLGGVIQQ